MLTKKFENVINLILCLACICFLLIYPAYCIEAAKDGLSTALYIVLPSIFPFMVLSKFIVSSGIYNTLSKLTGNIFETAFGINKNLASVFILGCLGGYPIGSVILSDLLKKNEISVHEAQHLVGICNNASPMFVIGTVGTLLLNNTNYGYILYTVHFISVCLCGVIMKVIFRPEVTGSYCKSRQKSSSPLSEAVTSSGLNMVNVSSYIIIFSVISEFVIMLFKGTNCSFILCLLEITNGIKHSVSGTMPEVFKLSMISFAIGFSGLCVFSQSRAVFGELNISFLKYFVAKSLTAIISFVLSYLAFTNIFSH